jgi:hypothetical protein
MQYFIQMLFHASWVDTPQTTRLWLGTWQLYTLQSLLGHTADEHLTAKQRHSYIRVVKLMTAPLLKAYGKMINLTMNTRTTRTALPIQDSLPLYDHLPPDTAVMIYNTALTPTDIPISTAQAQVLEALFPQNLNLHTHPTVYNAHNTLTNSIYSISDAAFSVEDADGLF